MRYLSLLLLAALALAAPQAAHAKGAKNKQDPAVDNSVEIDTKGSKKGKKDKPIKSMSGGAPKKWACKQLADMSCELAKRCDPDKAKRRCKTVRERCDFVKDGPARNSTEDDVNICVQSLDELGCHSVSFDNVDGVVVDLRKYETCNNVTEDSLFPSAHGGGAAEGQDEEKDREPRKGAED